MSNINPEFKAYGSARMRWVENESIKLRDANDYLRGQRIAHTNGYYCDEFDDEVAVPAVYVTDNPVSEPWRGSAKDRWHYYAAVRDPVNDGCACVDFEESYADPEEAARAAHGLAERYAAAEREYREKETARMQAQEILPDELRYVRHKHTRAIKIDDAIGARMRAEFRIEAAELIKRIRKLNDQYNGFKE